MNTLYDNTLLGILQNEGKLEKFLDVIFSFLMRRTDFFHIMTEENKKLGFPPGVNLTMVLKAFEKYKTVFENYQKQAMEVSNPKSEVKVDETKSLSNPASESETTEVVESGDPKELTQSQDPGKDALQPSPEKEPESDDPGVYQAKPECYNGAVRDKYAWSQTIKDIDIRIKVPETVRTAKDVNVAIGRKNIRVSLKQDSNQEPYFDRELCWEIQRDEAVWTLDLKESQIHISLDKIQERWWEAAFVGEEKINTRKIDCSRPIHELDEEAQAKIHQLMYDEQRKRQGLPTVEQEKIQNMLAEAWDKEGSPFRGRPYDPTKIKMDGSSMHIES